LTDDSARARPQLDRRHVARTLSAVEGARPAADAVLRRAYSLAEPPPVIGVAGPPGAGKSTLIDHLALHWAEAGRQVAVIAIDPSSPYSGGALLGDRLRMGRAAEHPRVVVRSLASRGQRGGLSRAAHDVVAACGALGFDRVIVETVGSGQADVDVADLADAVVVVAVPGLGDQVQAGKAGLLEIGDLFVVNKADLAGSEAVALQLQNQLDLIYTGRAGRNPPVPSGHGRAEGNARLHRRHGRADAGPFWRPPVLRTAAASGAGVAELALACDDFLGWQREQGRDQLRREDRLGAQLMRLAASAWQQRASGAGATAALADGVRALREGRCAPGQAAQVLLRAICRDIAAADARDRPCADGDSTES
jgi:LAO/AO transport system kinase